MKRALARLSVYLVHRNVGPREGGWAYGCTRFVAAVRQPLTSGGGGCEELLFRVKAARGARDETEDFALSAESFRDGYGRLRMACSSRSLNMSIKSKIMGYHSPNNPTL
jgi:hypothetical protein